MNRRILRNGLLIVVLSAAALLLPASKSTADGCSDACQACLNDPQNANAYYSCVVSCNYPSPGFWGPSPCVDACFPAVFGYCFSL
jgi:hypothetical protein